MVRAVTCFPHKAVQGVVLTRCANTVHPYDDVLVQHFFLVRLPRNLRSTCARNAFNVVRDAFCGHYSQVSIGFDRVYCVSTSVYEPHVA